MSEPMILVYDDAGRPQYTVNHPWSADLEPYLIANSMNYVICDEQPIHLIYVEDGEVKPRLTGPWVFSANSATPGETITISELPEGTIVTIGSWSETVNDGELEIEVDDPGLFEVHLWCWPYLQDIQEVMINEA